MNDATLDALTRIALKFRTERDWQQFHNPKELALDICVEAAEVAEHMLWKSPEEMDAFSPEKRAEIGDELSDVLHAVLLLAHDLQIDLSDAFVLKMKENAEKYPVDKARGRSTKYNEL